MKKTCFLTLIAALLIGMLPSCTPQDDPSHLTEQVIIITEAPSLITARTATCGAEVTAENPGLLLELGVCWSLSPNPTIDDFSKKSNKCSEPFSCKLTGLEPNTQYYVRGFAKYGTEYCYGSEMTFTTLDPSSPGASPVTTPEPFEITAHSFACRVTVEPMDVSNWYVGVCYSREPEFTYEDAEGSALGEYAIEDEVYEAEIHCYELMANTQYYYRAFVFYRDEYTNELVFYYGDILSLTTPDVVFELTLGTFQPDYYYGSHYMIAYGEITCSKPELVNQVGFCYSKTNQYPQYESDLYTICASPTGSDTYYTFDSYISNLSSYSKYYVRSYARYMTDSIKYGNVVTVDTYK